MSMAGNVGVFVLLSALWILVAAVFVRGRLVTFQEDFHVTWADNHVTEIDQGNTIQLTLDQNTGGGFASNNKYMFARVGAMIKLITGDSAGTVTAFYLNSDTNNVRDELDFEFLGNRSGQPYTVQTNIYINGKDDREQRFSLWFDPTENFHFYTIMWSPHLIVFYIDGVPIRVHKNDEARGIPYPAKQPMGVYCSLWSADWATMGGLEKIDWSKAPFKAYYQDFGIDGCPVAGPGSVNCEYPSIWSRDLTQIEAQRYKWARQNYMSYDYCQDKSRFPVAPPECVTGL